MDILITAATEKELMAVRNSEYKGINIDFLCTGIGASATAYLLTKKICHKPYNLIINTGICGSFTEKHPIGSILHIVSDQFADLGVPSPNGFSTLFDMGFMDKNKAPFTNGKLENTKAKLLFPQLKQATAITVSQITSTDQVAAERHLKYIADTESMEGAAFFMVCFSEHIPCVQIRTVSNFTGQRDKSMWDINKALEVLTQKFPILLTQVKDNLTKQK